MSIIYMSDSELLNDEPVFPEHETGQPRLLDYLGYAPCPIRGEMRKRMHRHFRAHAARGASAVNWYVPVGCGDRNVYEDLWKPEHTALLPDLISEVGFGDFLRPGFLESHERSATFAELPLPTPSPLLAQAGVRDPAGTFTVYGLFPYVILADLPRLNGRPLPRTWLDLCDPTYRNDIIMGGWDGDIQEVLLFSLHQQGGEAALRSLAPNVKDFWHAAEMAKHAGTTSPKGAALYVLSSFFASTCPNRETTRIVWPEEGALCTPLYLLRKRNHGPAQQQAVDFLLGRDWASFMARQGFPPAVEPAAPAKPLPGALRWVGWDYIRSHDLEELRTSLNKAFAEARKA